MAEGENCMKRQIKFVLLALFCAALCSKNVFALPSVLGDLASVPDGNATVVDDFEKGNYWIWAAFDWEQYGPAKLSTAARVTSSWAAQGKCSLECRFIPSYKDSDKDGTYYMDYKWNFSGSRYLVLDIFNPEKYAFDFAVVFQTTENWEWKEFTTVRVEPGAHTIVLSLANAGDTLSLVQRVNVCYRELTPMEGRFYVDNIRLVK